MCTPRGWTKLFYGTDFQTPFQRTSCLFLTSTQFSRIIRFIIWILMSISKASKTGLSVALVRALGAFVSLYEATACCSKVRDHLFANLDTVLSELYPYYNLDPQGHRQGFQDLYFRCSS
jgi:hypothetical protein